MEARMRNDGLNDAVFRSYKKVSALSHWTANPPPLPPSPSQRHRQMSAHDQAAAAILAQVALAADGAILGLALAYVAVRSFIRLSSTSTALRQIDQSPSFRVSDLRSLLSPSSDDESDQSTSSDGLLVVVRGTVEAKSAIDGNWKSLRPNVLVSHESGEKGVILQRTQTVCLKFSYLYFRLVGKRKEQKKMGILISAGKYL